MKKQGFTLLELLAVIVILAIIALITVPIVLKMIENSKQGAAKSGATAYMNSLEKSLVSSTLDGTNVQAGEYKLGSDGNIKTPVALEVKVKGTKANEGKVCINYKGVVVGYSVKVGNLFVTSSNGKRQKITEEFSDIDCKEYDDGTVVYFNPTIGKSCSANEAVSTTGIKDGCMKWYIFNDNIKSTSVNLLLDHNTTASGIMYTSLSNCDVAKCNSTPDLLMKKLSSDTSSWASGLEPRIITADEIAKITGADEVLGWNSKTSKGTLVFTTTSDSDNIWGKNSGYDRNLNNNFNSKWLSDSTDCEFINDCENKDEKVHGYLTTTPAIVSDDVSGSLETNEYLFAWVVYPGTGVMSPSYDVVNGRDAGLRPVISVSKSLIK